MDKERSRFLSPGPVKKLETFLMNFMMNPSFVNADETAPMFLVSPFFYRSNPWPRGNSLK